MPTLESKLNLILEEKVNKVKPGNIRKGIKIFNVTGTVEGGDVVLFETVTEMNQHAQDYNDGVYAVVASTNFEGAYKLINSVWVMVGEPCEELSAFNDLTEVVGEEELEYEGLGGTEAEIEDILTEVIEGSPEYTTNSVDYILNEEIIPSTAPNLSQSNINYVMNNTMFARMLLYDSDVSDSLEGCGGIVAVDKFVNAVRATIIIFDHPDEWDESIYTVHYLTNENQLYNLLDLTPEEVEESEAWEGVGWYEFEQLSGMEQAFVGKTTLSTWLLNYYYFPETYVCFQEINTHQSGYNSHNVQTSINTLLSIFDVTVREIEIEEEDDIPLEPID